MARQQHSTWPWPPTAFTSYAKTRTHTMSRAFLISDFAYCKHVWSQVYKIIPHNTRLSLMSSFLFFKTAIEIHKWTLSPFQNYTHAPHYTCLYILYMCYFNTSKLLGSNFFILHVLSDKAQTEAYQRETEVPCLIPCIAVQCTDISDFIFTLRRFCCKECYNIRICTARQTKAGQYACVKAKSVAYESYVTAWVTTVFFLFLKKIVAYL